MEKELIVLIGNIGSGKSTYSRKYQEKGYIIISRDQIRYSIGNGVYVYNTLYEPIVWKIEDYMLRKFLDLGVNIVVDEVGVTKQMREKYLNYALISNYRVIAIEMPRFSMEQSVERRLTNPHGQYNKQLWEKVWQKFDTCYEAPIKAEGFHEIIRLEEKDVTK